MLFRRIALLTFLLCVPPAFADGTPCGGVDLSADSAIKPDFKAHADDMLNGDGLLWRIDKPGLAPSYLYGTMHSTAEGPMRLAAQAAPYAEKATAIATELGAMGQEQKIEVGASMVQAAVSPNADTFAGVIEGQDAQRVEALLTAKGMPPLLAHHVKLWLLAVQASLPQCEIDGQAKGLPEVDESFAKIAEAHHIPIVGLESVAEQVRVLSSVNPNLAASELKSIARGGGYADGGYATLLSLYDQKRPTAALAVLDAAPGLDAAERAATAELTRLLLADRNDVMAQRAAPLLAKGGAFIAVGALHLSGKRGIIEILRREGYQVTNVW
jgi:uncharacterized protein YbaP (TraB family)